MCFDWSEVWEKCIPPDITEFDGFQVYPRRYEVRMLGFARFVFWPKINIKRLTGLRGINKWFWKWGDYCLQDGDAVTKKIAYAIDAVYSCVALNYNMPDNSAIIRPIRDFIVEVPTDIETLIPEFKWNKYCKRAKYPIRHHLYLGSFEYVFPKFGQHHICWFLLERLPER